MNLPQGRSGRLFGGEREGLAGFVNHFAHLADATGALRAALMTIEYILRTGCARLDGEGHITLSETVAVADVHEVDPRAIANGSLLAGRMRRLQVVRIPELYAGD